MCPTDTQPPTPASRTERHSRAAEVSCAICGRRLPAARTTPVAIIRPSLVERLRKDFPELPGDAAVCDDDLGRYRTAYVSEILHKERGELSELDREVIERMDGGELISSNVAAEFEDRRATGERLSDWLARFGGSWTFIVLFAVVIVAWMAINVVATAGREFDPYPFILLNLVLSCLAAIQAPIILMSQNRQEAKDRLRSENDYQVNLKAELEIRHLHEKIDHLLNRQWERLAEIQEIQLEIMQDIARRGSR
jgi:uncharacterized membrane protein